MRVLHQRVAWLEGKIAVPHAHFLFVNDEGREVVAFTQGGLLHRRSGETDPELSERARSIRAEYWDIGALTHGELRSLADEIRADINSGDNV